jgi:hypothetical protein
MVVVAVVDTRSSINRSDPKATIPDKLDITLNLFNGMVVVPIEVASYANQARRWRRGGRPRAQQRITGSSN